MVPFMVVVWKLIIMNQHGIPYTSTCIVWEMKALRSSPKLRVCAALVLVLWGFACGRPILDFSKSSKEIPGREFPSGEVDLPQWSGTIADQRGFPLPEGSQEIRFSKKPGNLRWHWLVSENIEVTACMFSRFVHYFTVFYLCCKYCNIPNSVIKGHSYLKKHKKHGCLDWRQQWKTIAVPGKGRFRNARCTASRSRRTCRRPNRSVDGGSSFQGREEKQT